MLCLNFVDFVMQPKSNDLAVSDNATLKPAHLNSMTLHNGPLEQKLSSLSIESSGYNWSSMLLFVSIFSYNITVTCTTIPAKQRGWCYATTARSSWHGKRLWSRQGFWPADSSETAEHPAATTKGLHGKRHRLFYKWGTV